MASNNEDKLLEIFSKHFRSGYKWLVFCKAKNINWCIENTVQIESGAAHLKKLFFKQITQMMIKRKEKKRKRLMNKCKVWILYFKQYGHQDIRTVIYFKKMVRYIVKIDDHYSGYNSHDDDDEHDDDVSQLEDSDGYDPDDDD